jgi:murein DD-endopeptidase MepM/ murein hydrolase activator NlpD
MPSMGSVTTGAVVLGAGLLLVPAVLMTMVLTGARTELPGGGCGTGAAAALEGGNVDELSREQVANAAVIVSVGLQLRVPRQGIVIALATASQESRFLNYANDGLGSDLKRDQRRIGRSLQLPHQAVGSDHGSLGVFQQQWPWWGSMRELMDPTTAASKFYARLVKVPGWDRMTVTRAAQAVQRSAYPDAYADDEALAVQILDDPGLAAGDIEQAVWTGDSGGGFCSDDAVFAGAVVMPLDTSARFTDQDNYGQRSGHWAHTHTGTDLSAACGTPVRAAHAGTAVVETDQAWAGKWLVKISTGEGGLTTWYAHMQKVEVENGQTVQVGEQIGEVGSLGNATGCHLHFEVHPKGGSIYEDDVDPSEWLQLRVGTQLEQVSATQPAGFTLASFNVLGHSHTAPGGERPRWADSRTRTRLAVQAIDHYGVEVVGLQEFQRPQHEEFSRVAGNRYAFWFPRGDLDNAIAWRRDRWAFVSSATIEVPYFEGHMTDMPVVRLRRLETGQDAIFVNIHNPADTQRHPGQKRFRDEALRREMVAAWGLNAHYQVPVFLTGDFNSRALAFCTLTSNAVLTASAGGSNADRCIVPKRARIDWIFGSAEISWAGHWEVHKGVRGRISDHPLILAQALIATEGQ